MPTSSRKINIASSSKKLDRRVFANLLLIIAGDLFFLHRHNAWAGTGKIQTHSLPCNGLHDDGFQITGAEYKL